MDFQVRPAMRTYVITPHATNDLTERIRAISIAVQGTISYQNWEGVDCVTDELPPGLYPIYMQKVYVSGTTATGLTGFA